MTLVFLSNFTTPFFQVKNKCKTVLFLSRPVGPVPSRPNFHDDSSLRWNLQQNLHFPFRSNLPFFLFKNKSLKKRVLTGPVRASNCCAESWAFRFSTLRKKVKKWRKRLELRDFNEKQGEVETTLKDTKIWNRFGCSLKDFDKISTFTLR